MRRSRPYYNACDDDLLLPHLIRPLTRHRVSAGGAWVKIVRLSQAQFAHGHAGDHFLDNPQTVEGSGVARIMRGANLN